MEASDVKIHVMQLIISLDIGGAERLAETISTSLPKDKFKVSICGLFGQEGPLAEDLRKKGIPYFFLDAGKFSKVVLFKKFYHLLRQHRVDILQIHGAYLLLNCFLPAKLSGVRIVYTEHAKQSITRLRLVNLAARFFPYWTSKVVCVSENLRQFFIEELRIPEERLLVIHNGVDTKRFWTNKVPFPEDNKIVCIGCIARLTEPKHHENLLEAFSRLEPRRYGLKLLLVGEGEMRSSIEGKIIALGISDIVELAGNRNDVPEQLANMDIFVLPSKREGFPISILEAMAAGKPVVATNVGGVAEVIVSGDNGLIVPPSDPEALQAALKTLLDNPKYARDLAVSGQVTVNNKFSLNQMMNSYESLFLGISGMRNTFSGN